MDSINQTFAQVQASVNEAVNDAVDAVKDMVKPAGPLDPLMEAIGSSNEIYITQSVGWAEALTGGMCEQANKYAITGPGAGEDPTNGPLLYIANERGNCLHRICCAPQNGLFLDLYPVPSGYSGADTQNYVAKTNFPTEEAQLMQNPPQFSMERPGCCTGNNCLCCPAVLGMCTDKMTLHRGYVKGEPGAVEKSNPVLFLKQTPGLGGAMLAPEIICMTEENGVANGDQVTISGPMCFGGCSEFCMDAPFVAKDSRGNLVGEIRKMRPSNCTELMKEMFTDSDRFKITFNPGATPEAKAAMLSSAFLLDFMYFETDISCCKCSDKGIQFNCINCYCCGALCPCTCTCPLGGGGGGDSNSE